MTASNVPDDLEIAPGYTVGCWKGLRGQLDAGNPNSDHWTKAIEIFETRIRRRFFEPVDELLQFDSCIPNKTFGFAILAIDCLVIETLQGFREGIVDHANRSRDLFTNFLIQWVAFNDCVPPNGSSAEFAKQVYRGYRCALHHSGSTEVAFRIWTVGPMFNFNGNCGVAVNRTCLHRNLKLEFDAYMADLRMKGKIELRGNFKKKMDSICGL